MKPTLHIDDMEKKLNENNGKKEQKMRTQFDREKRRRKNKKFHINLRCEKNIENPLDSCGCLS